MLIAFFFFGLLKLLIYVTKFCWNFVLAFSIKNKIKILKKVVGCVYKMIHCVDKLVEKGVYYYNSLKENEMRRFVRVLLRVSGSYLIFISLILVVFLYLLHLTSREVVHMTHIRTYTQPPHIQEVDQCKYPHNYYVPWYKSSELYRYFQLVFYKKQKMGNAITVARNKGWSVSGIIKSRNKLDSIVKGNIFTVLFTSSKELSSTLLEEYANKTNMLSTGILGAYQFTGSKKEQYLTYQQYLNRFRCSIEELKFMPVLYLLDNGNHCRSFFEKLKAGGEQGLWVLKNSRGYGGDQVQVVHNTSLLTARFGSCKNNEEFIVQEYIQSLLLLDNRKFDVRALVLIAGTQPYLLFYHHGYLRVVLKQFDLKASREVHLTNTHVQSQQPGFSPEEHFWSFTKFQSYLDQHYPDNGQFVHEKLIPHIKRTSLMILKSGMVFQYTGYYLYCIAVCLFTVLLLLLLFISTIR